ncbi:uncharacterized protein HKW66_Vig0108510 [Vigna angularis]|uniref:Uncharacterized protein n=1 Tax=Phaseolus angularis TaxID=3914 RepID=A0A8T0KUI1_PHAAN|nr:uncharacterized protein HKW66_Vig0108510 [Vigna angularis]
MNSSRRSESEEGGLRKLSSPIAYLFGGSALMLAVIAVALLIIACCYRKHYYASNSAGDEEKAAKMEENKVNISEPQIVVIMAGETNPTYLANPLSCTA